MQFSNVTTAISNQKMEKQAGLAQPWDQQGCCFEAAGWGMWQISRDASLHSCSPLPSANWPYPLRNCLSSSCSKWPKKWESQQQLSMSSSAFAASKQSQQQSWRKKQEVAAAILFQLLPSCGVPGSFQHLHSNMWCIYTTDNVEAVMEWSQGTLSFWSLVWLPFLLPYSVTSSRWDGQDMLGPELGRWRRRRQSNDKGDGVVWDCSITTACPPFWNRLRGQSVGKLWTEAQAQKNPGVPKFQVPFWSLFHLEPGIGNKCPKILIRIILYLLLALLRFTLVFLASIQL